MDGFVFKDKQKRSCLLSPGGSSWATKTCTGSGGNFYGKRRTALACCVLLENTGKNFLTSCLGAWAYLRVYFKTRSN